MERNNLILIVTVKMDVKNRRRKYLFISDLNSSFTETCSFSKFFSHECIGVVSSLEHLEIYDKSGFVVSERNVNNLSATQRSSFVYSPHRKCSKLNFRNKPHTFLYVLLCFYVLYKKRKCIQLCLESGISLFILKRPLSINSRKL